MRRIVSILLALMLCGSFTGCEGTFRDSVPTYPKPVPEPKSGWYIEGAYFPNFEGMDKADVYLKATQVPMGKVIISEKLQTHLKIYEDDDILIVGASYAAMLSENMRGGDSRSAESLLAAKQLESQVIRIGLDLTNLDYFHIVATKSQIKKLSCGHDVALYIFAATDLF